MGNTHGPWRAYKCWCGWFARGDWQYYAHMKDPTHDPVPISEAEARQIERERIEAQGG